MASDSDGIRFRQLSPVDAVFQTEGGSQSIEFVTSGTSSRIKLETNDLGSDIRISSSDDALIQTHGVGVRQLELSNIGQSAGSSIDIHADAVSGVGDVNLIGNKSISLSTARLGNASTPPDQCNITLLASDHDDSSGSIALSVDTLPTLEDGNVYIKSGDRGKSEGMLTLDTPYGDILLHAGTDATFLEHGIRISTGSGSPTIVPEGDIRLYAGTGGRVGGGTNIGAIYLETEPTGGGVVRIDSGGPAHMIAEDNIIQNAGSSIKMLAGTFLDIDTGSYLDADVITNATLCTDDGYMHFATGIGSGIENTPNINDVAIHAQRENAADSDVALRMFSSHDVIVQATSNALANQLGNGGILLDTESKLLATAATDYLPAEAEGRVYVATINGFESAVQQHDTTEQLVKVYKDGTDAVVMQGTPAFPSGPGLYGLTLTGDGDFVRWYFDHIPWDVEIVGAVVAVSFSDTSATCHLELARKPSSSSAASTTGTVSSTTGVSPSGSGVRYLIASFNGGTNDWNDAGTSEPTWPSGDWLTSSHRSSRQSGSGNVLWEEGSYFIGMELTSAHTATVNAVALVYKAKASYP